MCRLVFVVGGGIVVVGIDVGGGVVVFGVYWCWYL